MAEELVCIILVNYNGYKDTIECVQSIQKSNYRNYKMILVDNGSSDAKQLQDDIWLQQNTDIILAKENVGFSGGNNIGIEYAKEKYNPDYYLLLNNDTVIATDTINKLVEVYKNNSNVGIVAGKIYYYDYPNKIWFAGGEFNYNTARIIHSRYGKEDSDKVSITKDITFATGCVMLISKDVFDKVGYLDESYFLYSEDTDYCCRVSASGYRIIYTSDAHIWHKVSASTGLHSKIQQYYMFRNNCYMVKRYCKHPFLGYLTRFYYTLKGICSGKFQLKVLIMAWKDFRKGVVGAIEDGNF